MVVAGGGAGEFSTDSGLELNFFGCCLDRKGFEDGVIAVALLCKHFYSCYFKYYNSIFLMLYYS